jgi:hypothetical protein
MASIPSLIGGGEHSFRHDPRMRQAVARLAREDRTFAQTGPAGTSLYWLLRSRRPKLAAISGRFSGADRLVIACALADCGAKLVVDPAAASEMQTALAPSGLDWILRSGDCLPCLRRLQTFDGLILGPGHGPLDTWQGRLGPDALRLGLARTAHEIRGLAAAVAHSAIAEEVSELQDGRRYLLIADGEGR